MTKKKTAEHVVLGNNSLRCLNCGDEYHINMQGRVSAIMFMGLARGYGDDHRACKPSARGRARFEYTTPEQWAQSWDTGSSSLTIYNFFRSIGGRDGDRAEVPHDPSDFGRCYRLLKVAPEWRERLSDLGVAIPKWDRLVADWSSLELLFEEESPSGQCPKLYARIQELTQ